MSNTIAHNRFGFNFQGSTSYLLQSEFYSFFYGPGEDIFKSSIHIKLIRHVSDLLHSKCNFSCCQLTLAYTHIILTSLTTFKSAMVIYNNAQDLILPNCEVTVIGKTKKVFKHQLGSFRQQLRSIKVSLCQQWPMP